MLIGLYVFAYLLGGVPFGYLIAKSRGVDLTKIGSGNIGATNVLRALGPAYGIPAFILDVAKGALPPVCVQSLMSGQFPPLEVANHAVLTGVLAVLGHSFSPFLRFRGGKSVATGLGALLGTSPIVGLSAFGAFVLVYGLTQFVSLGSILGCMTAIVVAFATRQAPLFLVVYTVVPSFVIWRHRENIRRLFRGEEPKTPMRRPKKPEDGPRPDSDATKEPGDGL